jgi:hypothetical protein
VPVVNRLGCARVSDVNASRNIRLYLFTFLLESFFLVFRPSCKCPAAVGCGLSVLWDGLTLLLMIFSDFIPQLCWRLGNVYCVFTAST